MKTKQHGNTLVGIIIGVVLGLAAALAVAVYVTKVPVPFLNKGPSRSPEQDAAESRKNQKTLEIKEIKLRPAIDDHDYDVKMKAMRRFFEEGDKVKVTLRFRGREMAHQEIGFRLLNRVKDDTGTIAKVESDAALEGRQMVMVLAPR